MKTRLVWCVGLSGLLLSAAIFLPSCGSTRLDGTPTAPLRTGATTYYVNCATGNDSNAGTSATSAWGSLGKVNGTTFEPGDSILLARGTKCHGQLWPKGSGTSSAVITLADYGTGSLPLIDAGTNQSALRLFDQSYWEVKNLETTGGNPYGIWVSGNTSGAVIHHVHLSNVAVHDVTGTPTQKAGGLIVFSTQGAGESFDDILVDGATAYNTTQWSGIGINGATWSSAPGVKGTNITIRNSTVHDVGGDGIVIFIARQALIEKSVAYNTGQTPVTSVGTPVAIWNWDCDTCTVQFNETYLNHTPTTHDGGDYDSDYYNTNNTIQCNYGHDADGYCVSVFGAEGKDTNVNTVIRYNVCSNNGRHPQKAYQGDFFYSTWDSGSILNSRVYNNTSYWNPADPAAYALYVLNSNPANGPAMFDPSQPNYFVNNIVYAAVPGMETFQAASGTGLTSDYNIFWRTGSVAPQWRANGVTYTTLAGWQSNSGQDTHSLFRDPLLNNPTYHGVGRPTSAFTLLGGSPAINAGWNLGNMGSQDFFGNPLPSSGPVDIGADQAPAGAGASHVAPGFDLPAVRGGRYRLADLLAKKQTLLLSFINSRPSPLSPTERDASRAQIVFLKSMAEQYRPKGVTVAIVDASRLSGAPALRPGALLDFSYDWQLDSVPLLCDDGGRVASAYGVSTLPTTFLIASDGRVRRRWLGFVPVAQLALALEPLVASPPFRR